MTTKRFIINSVKAWGDFIDAGVRFWQEHKYITVTISDKRSLDQNAAIRVCYKQILEQSEGWTPIDVERHCKLNYGVPIRRMNDPVDDHVYGELMKIYNYERMLKIMDMFQVTSKMSTEEGKQYINTLMTEYPFIELSRL